MNYGQFTHPVSHLSLTGAVSGGSSISQTGGANPKMESQSIIWPDFSRKLDEKERNWTEGDSSLAPLPWIGQWLWYHPGL